MDFAGVKEMLDAVNSSDISYFDYETCDGHIIMDKSLTRNIGEKVSETNSVSTTSGINLKTTNDNNLKSTNITSSNEDDKKDSANTLSDTDLYIVKSPMVGTFYKAAAEGKAPFVEEGKEIKKGDVLCIIEAMKLMNEIESEVDGKVVEVLVKDGEMVEYDQPLFKVKESK